MERDRYRDLKGREAGTKPLLFDSERRALIVAERRVRHDWTYRGGYWSKRTWSLHLPRVHGMFRGEWIDFVRGLRLAAQIKMEILDDPIAFRSHRNPMHYFAISLGKLLGLSRRIPANALLVGLTVAANFFGRRGSAPPREGLS